MPRPLIDAHLDLSWLALGFDRDLTKSIAHLRQWEQHVTDSRARGQATVNFDQMRSGGVGLCFGTLLARAMPDKPSAEEIERQGSPVGSQRTDLPPEGMKRLDLDYANAEIAHGIAQGQLGWYRLMEQQGHLRMIRSRAELDEHWRQWQRDAPNCPIGMILSMEGADPIVEPDQVLQWWDQGLRALGPMHYGRNRYTVGTGFDGPVTEAGRALLSNCETLGILIDLTHLSDTSMWDTLDAFGGRVIASHHNCRQLVPGVRQLTDQQIQVLIQREAVIGTALDAWMLQAGFERGTSDAGAISLDAVADQIDHVCQIAGNTRHAGIGSDLDGGFGANQTPGELDTIADLQKIAAVLESRGYAEADIDAIFYGNWLRLLRESLPA